MLKQRVITAILMAAVLAAALFLLPGWAWGLFVAFIVAVGGQEWARLNGWEGTKRYAFMLACAIFPAMQGFIDLGLLARGLMLIGVAFWIIEAPRCLLRMVPFAGRPWALPIGLCMLIPASIAMVQLRNAQGALVLLAFIAAVWVADIAAYFVGRSIGRRKLAPRVSPGKSWEGAVGGAVGVLIYAVILRETGFGPLQTVAWPLLIIGALAYTALSIVGDLLESLAKRQAGMKDSGTILPGHGGILDRVDSLTSTLPIAGFLLLG